MKNLVLCFLSLFFFSGCGKKEGGEARTDPAAPAGSASASADSGHAPPAGKTYRIAVIPKGTTHEFWKSIHAGALKAAAELGRVEIEWKGPQKEDDREAQITVVEDFIAKKVDGMVLAPLDDKALVAPVSDATAAGIPVVIIDSGLDGEAHKSLVSTDNFNGGRMAAEHLGAVTGGKGRLLVLRYQEGSASTMERERGFLETVKAKFPGLEILSDNQYAGPTTETALQQAENLLVRHPQVTAVFCPNESSTFGMLRALKDVDKAGKVILVGFDASKPLVEALAAGEIEALVVQNPLRMGYLGVKTLVSVLKGETVVKVQDTGAELVTKANMTEPAKAELLNPPLDRYLSQNAN